MTEGFGRQPPLCLREATARLILKGATQGPIDYEDLPTVVNIPAKRLRAFVTGVTSGDTSALTWVEQRRVVGILARLEKARGRQLSIVGGESPKRGRMEER